MKVGIIGTGFGARVVAPAFAAAAGTTVAEVASPRDTDAVARLCARSDIDLVSIHSPPFMHREHLALAAASGKAVLCDKPLGVSAADARACLEIVQRGGVRHFLNVEFRCSPIREKLREMVKAGAVGRVEHVSWTQHSVGARVPLRPYGWLFDASRGGGWVGAWASHAVDFLRWTVGEIGEVSGTRRLVIAERPDRDGKPQRCTAEDALAAILRIDGGATALFDSSFVAAAPIPLRIAVLGSEGALIDDGERSLTWLCRGKSEIVAESDARGDPHVLPMQRYCARLADLFAGRSGLELPTLAEGAAFAPVLDRLRALPLVS